MLIAETLALVALDIVGGEARPNLRRLHDERVLVAALLMELATQTRAGQRDGVVVVLDTLPSRHPLLNQCLQVLHRVSGRCTAPELLDHAVQKLGKVRIEVLEGLVRRDVLHPAVRTLPFFGHKRFAVRSTQAQTLALDVLRHACTGADASLLGLAVLALSVATDVDRALLTPEESTAARARMADLRSEITAELASEQPSDDLYAIDLLLALAAEVARA